MPQKTTPNKIHKTILGAKKLTSKKFLKIVRSLLLSGDIYISPISDWRREADKNYQFFHPCASYPVSDLEISVPRKV